MRIPKPVEVAPGGPHEIPVTDDRYVVSAVAGYSGAAGGGASLRTSYSVLDTACCSREVFVAYTFPGERSRQQRYRACVAEADRLNALDRVAA